jgi:hypothetical protein
MTNQKPPNLSKSKTSPTKYHSPLTIIKKSMGCAESSEMPLKLAVAKRSLVLNLALLESPSSASSHSSLNSPTFRKLALRTLVRYTQAIMFRSVYYCFKFWKKGKMDNWNLSDIESANVTFTDDTFNLIYPLKEQDDLLYYFPEGQKQLIFEIKLKPNPMLLFIDSEISEEKFEVFTFSLAKKIITHTEALIEENKEKFDVIHYKELSEVQGDLKLEGGNERSENIKNSELEIEYSSDVIIDDDQVFKDSGNFNRRFFNFSQLNLVRFENSSEKSSKEKIKSYLGMCIILKTKPLIPPLYLFETLNEFESTPEVKVTTKDATINTSFSQNIENFEDLSSKVFQEDSFHSSGKISPDIQAHPSPRSLIQMSSDSVNEIFQETENLSKLSPTKKLKIQKKIKIEPQIIKYSETLKNEIIQITPLIKNITLPEILEKNKLKEKPPLGSKIPSKIVIFHQKSSSRGSIRSPSPKFQSATVTQQEKTEKLIKSHKKHSSNLNPLLSSLAPSQSKDSLPFNQVLKIFEDLMDKKFALDQKELKEQVKPRELAEFFPDYLNRNFGIQKVGQRMLGKFLASLKNYSSHPYIKLLCRFLRVECEDPVSLNLLVFLCKARNDFNSLLKNSEKKVDDKSLKITGGTVQLIKLFGYLSKEFKDPEVYAEVVSRMCPGSLKFEEYLIFYSLNKIVKTAANIQITCAKDVLSSILNSLDFTLTTEQLTNLSSFVLSSENKQILNRFSFSAYKSCRSDPRYSINKCEFLEGLISTYENFKNLAILMISQVLSNFEVLDRISFIKAVSELDSSFSFELKERLFDEGKKIEGSELISEETFTLLMIQSGIWKLCYFRKGYIDHKLFNEAYKPRRVDYADLCIKPSDAFDLRSSVHRSQTLKNT